MSFESLKLFQPHAETNVGINRLPHWEQSGATYFVTFRTADSLPAGLVGEFRQKLDNWLKHHPKPWDDETAEVYWKNFGHKTELWLDEGHGECALRKPQLAHIVAEALRYHEGSLCKQHAWVVMPNHVHTLFSLIENATLPALIHSWKSYTSKEINRILGRSGTFWQKDYFDRLVRTGEHFWRCARYIRRNPANLAPVSFLLWQADWVSNALDP
jgi:putative transposase